MQITITRLAARCCSLLTVISLASAAVPSIDFAHAQEATRARKSGSKLDADFKLAAKEFGVPRDLLAAIAYAETHFDDHDGEPSHANGYGVMHLVESNEAHTLSLAAKLLQLPADDLKHTAAQNIRGAAAVLRSYADGQGLDAAARANLGAWYEAVARYSNATSDEVARLYADEVFRLLASGFSGESTAGARIKVRAQRIGELQRGRYTDAVPAPARDYSPAAATPPDGDYTIQSADYNPALWVPANSGNYTNADRESDYQINYVVIHTMQGSYAGSINWFQNPSSNVSAHYMVRSSDGQITQMVDEQDIAYHVRSYNTNSIGIEHEGYVDNASWYTDAMYRASAGITRSVCLKYGIPMTRAHILGHNEVPGNDHTDPGPNWNWTYYMQLVTQSPAWSQTVDNTTAGRFTASANWGASAYSTARYGADYRYANPQAVSDAAWYKFNVPATADYEVYAWYPAAAGYNASTPYVIETTGGARTVRVDQQVNGGAWVSLGVHTIAAGERNVVGVSRWTSTTGYVIADAVRLVRR